MHVRLDGPNRTLDDELDADGGGEMNNDVTPVHELRENRQISDGIDRVSKSLMLFEMGDVFDAAGGQVINDMHVVPSCQICVGQMRSDEPRSAGNEDLHSNFLLVIGIGASREARDAARSIHRLDNLYTRNAPDEAFEESPIRPQRGIGNLSVVRTDFVATK
jgi:hypothetical protein